MGLIAARVLATRYPSDELLLTSRSGRVQAGSEMDWELLAYCDVRVHNLQCDMSEVSAVHGAAWKLHGWGLRLRSVFHAAGVLADATLANQTVGRFGSVYGSKVGGAQRLHEASACWALESMVVCSSIASLLGAAGQAPHSAASAWLDRFAEMRCSHALGAHSLQLDLNCCMHSDHSLIFDFTSLHTSTMLSSSALLNLHLLLASEHLVMA